MPRPYDGAVSDLLPASAATEPHWLTPEERQAWLALTGILIKLPGLLDGQLGRDDHLSFFEYMVLAMLSEADDHRMRMTRLSILTNGSLSRLSHVAKRLEQSGYIRREPDPRDRRSTNAILTARGLAKIKAAAPGHVMAARRFVFDALTPAPTPQLTDVGEAILRRMEQHAGAPPASELS